MEHCKLLSLAHCHCYVVAVYKSLALQQLLSYEDMESAVAQCEENLIEINITNYIKSVCRHLSTLSEDSLLNQLKVTACNDVKPLHNLIKDKFKRIMAVAFRPVPAHPEFYYCLPSWVSDKMVCFFVVYFRRDIITNNTALIILYIALKIYHYFFRKWCRKGRTVMSSHFILKY